MSKIALGRRPFGSRQSCHDRRDDARGVWPVVERRAASEVIFSDTHLEPVAHAQHRVSSAPLPTPTSMIGLLKRAQQLGQKSIENIVMPCVAQFSTPTPRSSPRPTSAATNFAANCVLSTPVGVS